MRGWRWAGAVAVVLIGVALARADWTGVECAGCTTGELGATMTVTSTPTITETPTHTPTPTVAGTMTDTPTVTPTARPGCCTCAAGTENCVEPVGEVCPDGCEFIPNAACLESP